MRFQSVVVGGSGGVKHFERHRCDCDPQPGLQTTRLANSIAPNAMIHRRWIITGTDVPSR